MGLYVYFKYRSRKGIACACKHLISVSGWVCVCEKCMLSHVAFMTHMIPLCELSYKLPPNLVHEREKKNPNYHHSCLHVKFWISVP